MLKFDKTRPLPSLDDNLIPMVNIVFLLLIFFMIAGEISKISPAELSLPTSTTTQALEQGEVEITLEKTGQVLLNGAAIARQELEAGLRASGVNKDSAVICRADLSLKASALDPVMSAVAALEIRQIRFVTEQATQ